MSDLITTMRRLIIERLNDNNETWSDIEEIKIVFDYHGSDASDYPINHYSFNYVCDPVEEEDSKIKLKDLTQDELLDKEFYFGYGAPCPIYPYIWTKNYIYYHHEYDGFDSIRSIPRNP